MSDEMDPHSDEEREDQDSSRPGMTAYLHMSQFAWTLVLVSCILGYAGHWLGSFLGAPWDVIFMIVFGLTGFGLEMWRMITKVNEMIKKS